MIPQALKEYGGLLKLYTLAYVMRSLKAAKSPKERIKKDDKLKGF